MTRDSLSNVTSVVANGWRSWQERWFAGLTRKGVAIVAALCLVNALRRTIDRFFDEHYELGACLLQLGELFATGLITMLLTTFAVVVTYNRVPATPRLRYPMLVLAVVVGSAVGTVILVAIESRLRLENIGDSGGRVGAVLLTFVGLWARYAGLGLLIAAVFVFFRQREESEAARRKAELDRERLGQQMDEARLQVLQAQIEPHFLFNTLANVRRLYQTDAAAAESMLDNLMRYLAVALPQMRAADSTLGREAALAESYLVIQRIRMGRRLAFEIDVPQSLREAAVPPMMLLTLVENAIKHGISPLPEGGSVRVSARVADRQLRLQVADSGQGFTKTSGGGTGLANTRARLVAMYGAAAHLRIEINSPRGVTAIIALPYAASAPTTSPP